MVDGPTTPSSSGRKWGNTSSASSAFGFCQPPRKNPGRSHNQTVSRHRWTIWPPFDSMHFSQYLENAVFYEQSPATAQLFDEKSHQLFEATPEKCCVEIHVQLPFQPHADQYVAETPSSLVSSFVHSEPPSYTGSRSLQINNVNDPKKLAQVAAVSRYHAHAD